MDNSVLFRRRRFRHGYLNSAHRERAISVWVYVGIVAGIVIGGIALWKLLTWIQADWRVEHPEAVAQVESGNAATIAVDGNDPLRIEGTVKMYEGDAIHTEARSTAAVAFFDTTRMHLDGETSLTIENMRRGRQKDAIGIELSRGTIWIATPKTTASGTMRRVTTPVFSLEFPPGTEALVSERSLAVFDSGDALGVVLRIPGAPSELYIGEGQQIALPAELRAQEQNLYAFRSPLDAVLSATPFVENSRRAPATAVAQQEERQLPAEEILHVLAPEEGEMSRESSIAVSGTIGKGVASIRVNGYPATIKGNAFSQELALPNDEEVNIRIAALDGNGIVIAEQSRTVRRDLQPPAPPAILLPAGSGATFRTAKTELELRGTAAKGIAGIMVNDYRLQLFQAGDTAWSYLASTKLGNLQWGMNAYDVVAIDDAGNRSATARITILLEQGEEGIVTSKQPGTGDQEPGTMNQNQETPAPILRHNPPKEPGSLRMTAPTNGEPYTTSRLEFSIYGTTSPSTHTVWVNDFRLRLYQPGNDAWKYIASIPMGTMKRGENVYIVITRDEEGNILDRKEYTVIFKPERE